ncbi:MAG: SulP family inorganic anion transporter [Mycobacterium sp.]
MSIGTNNPMPESQPLESPSVLDALKSIRLLRIEVFAGLVVALALIPETISFAVIAGVGPQIGLVTSFVFAMTIAIVGGRPAVISGAAGSVALILAPLVHDHGLNYLIATILVGGFLQVIMSLLGAAKLMRFVPDAVMTGFVNGLAILIAAAQLPQLVGVPWLVYPIVVVGVLIMVVLPRVAPAVPAPVVSTVILTAVAVLCALHVPNVGTGRNLSAELPTFALPYIPLTAGSVAIVLPYALAMALVGLLESFITAKIVDDAVGSKPSELRREGCGQGVTNIVVSLAGGMGGCAMIGQTMMNVKGCGGRTRISTFVAGLTILLLVVVASPVLASIPMAALVAVMVMVAFTTMNWKSLAPVTLWRAPFRDSLAMIVTIGVTVPTHNLAYGVIAGVIAHAAVRLCARRDRRNVTQNATENPLDERVYLEASGVTRP